MSSNAEYVVATEPLFIGPARAHNTGDLVRADTVDANGWGAQVSGVNTKAATQAMTAASTDAPGA